MVSEIIIVADLQRFKLFSIETDPLKRESAKLLENIESLETHQRVHEKVSDQYGNFQGRGATGVSASGAGEEHAMFEEKEHHRIKEIAQQIAEALQKYKPEAWCFSAPKAINKQIIELLTPHSKSNLVENLPLDLTKIHDNQLLQHFKK